MNKVSLILTTYNCKNNLEKTLESIESQDYGDIEVVIKDGNSVDGTQEVIKLYAQRSKFKVIWTSKSDSGIYDAMNYGYSMSKGDILLFFNDKFTCKNAVTKLVHAMEQTNTETNKVYDGVHSDLIYVDNDRAVRYWKMGQGRINYGWMPAHPTLCLRRAVYEKYGLYDSSYKCSADYEFMVRILSDNTVKLAYVPEILVSMFYGGTSSNGFKNYWISLKEAHLALKRNNVKNSWIIDLRRTGKVFRQFWMAKRIKGKI